MTLEKPVSGIVASPNHHHDQILVGWKEISRYLRCSIATAKRRADQDSLPVRRQGGKRVVARGCDLADWLKAAQIGSN